jgi:hypothetical protein
MIDPFYRNRVFRVLGNSPQTQRFDAREESDHTGMELKIGLPQGSMDTMQNSREKDLNQEK